MTVDLFRRPFIDDTDRRGAIQSLGGATVTINGISMDAMVGEVFNEIDLGEHSIESRDLTLKVVASDLLNIMDDPVNCVRGLTAYVATTGSAETTPMKIRRCEPVGNGFFRLQIRPQ